LFRYESKGKQWAKNKPTHVVGMAPSVSSTRQPIYLNANSFPQHTTGSSQHTTSSQYTTIPGLTINPAEQGMYCNFFIVDVRLYTKLQGQICKWEPRKGNNRKKSVKDPVVNLCH
jgi:hypothetical protein